MTEPRDPAVPEPLQRRTYEAAALVRQHPAVLRNENKQLLYAIACPPGAVHAGRLEYSRWPEIPLPLPRRGRPGPRCPTGRGSRWLLRLPPGPRSGRRRRVARQLRRSESLLRLWLGALRPGRDPGRRASGPRIAARGARRGRPTDDDERERAPDAGARHGGRATRQHRDRPGGREGRPELALRHGVCEGHAPTPSARRRHGSIRRRSPTSSRSVAPYGGRGRYQREQIGLAISTAYSGFRAAVLESRRTAGPDALVAIHSGFWGCGAFGGNRVMMTLVQLLAADMAGVARLVLHVGDPGGRTSVERALALAPDLATATSATELIARIEALGLVWGVSDGN